MSGKAGASGKRGAKKFVKAEYDRAALIADWKSGNFSQSALARRYGIARSTVQSHLRGIERDKPGHIPGGKQESAQDEKQGMTREERRRYVRFFNKAGMVVAQAAVRRVKAKPDMSMVEMRQASEIVNGQRAGILGKQPETAIQINNNAGAAAGGEGGAASLEQYQQAREKIVGEF